MDKGKDRLLWLFVFIDIYVKLYLVDWNLKSINLKVESFIFIFWGDFFLIGGWCEIWEFDCVIF